MNAPQFFVVAWIESTIAGALLLLVAWLALRHVKQPADRINVILISFTAAALAPLLVCFAPTATWRLGIVSAPPAESLLVIPQPHLADIPQSPLPAPPVLTSPGFEIANDSSPLVRQSTPSAAAPARSTNAWMIAALSIVTAQLVMALFLLAEWFIGFRRLRQLQMESTTPSDQVRAAWREVTAGRGDSVTLLISDRIETPIAFGRRRPAIVIPRSIAEGGAMSLKFCLAHEWSHIERGDLGACCFTGFCQYVLGLQPLFWRLCRELRVCQDILADNFATSAGRDSIEYSELLVGFAKHRIAHPVAGAIAFVDSSSQLTRRVRMLLTHTTSLRPRSRRIFCLATGVVALCFAALCSGVRLAEAQAAKKAEKKQEQPAAKTPAPKTESPPKESASQAPAPEKPAEPAPELRYNAVVLDKETGKGVPNARVTVRRSVSSQDYKILEESKHTTDADGKYSFVIPPDQVAERFLYIELDVEHDDYAAKKGFGYALSMILKNEPLGERPFFEKTSLQPAEPAIGTVLSPDGKPLAGVKVQGYSKSDAKDFRDYGSFTDTLTDAAGKFRLPLVKGGIGVLWVLPKDFASTSRAINKDARDLGEIQIKPGVRVSGRILDAKGEPVSGIPVNMEYSGGGTETVNNLPVASSIGRSAIADENGHFAFDPLPTGDYRVTPSERSRDPLTRERKRFEVPGVFLAVPVKIQEGVVAPPIEVQASPHVMFNAQIYDSKGNKARGHEVFIFGQLDGQSWFGQGRPNAEGTIATRVPHGLQNAQVQLMTNEHGALRFRRGKDKELESREIEIKFGTLNEDVNGFEIIKYKAPIVIARAIDENQQPINDYRVTAAYSWGKQRYILEGEERSDLSFEKQDDGRYRTSQMLPDEDVKFTIKAKGFETVTETVRLPEGETKDLVVTLKKAADSSPSTESPKAEEKTE